MEQTFSDSIKLLQQLISTESFSRNEAAVADIMFQTMLNLELNPQRSDNNVWAVSPNFDDKKPTILLDSHLDTVKPSSAYTRNPFKAEIIDEKLFGLGSNDAGGPLVSLLNVFCKLTRTEQPYNLIFSASVEEEISGPNGLASVLPKFGKIDLGIMGEPTSMQMAVAEKGLLVLDCYAKGVAGHAAHYEGVNAIYKALPDIEWFKTYQFDKQSDLLGPVKMTVTQIDAGTQHNAIPAECHFVVDVRVNEFYSNQELTEIIQQHVKCEVKPRSFRLNSSHILPTHPVVFRGKALGLETYGSPTTSNQAISPFATVKIGPGDSHRSHSADEFIYLDEIKNGIHTYYQLLNQLKI